MSKRHTLDIPRRVANPDDPQVKRPPRGARGWSPGPNYTGLQGHIALVQGRYLLSP